MSRYRFLVGVGLGTAVVGPLQRVMDRQFPIFSDSSDASIVLHQATWGFLSAMSMLLPGFVAGWLSRRRGFLAGAIAGLIGIATYTVFCVVVWPNPPSFQHTPTSENALFVFLYMAPQLALTCGMAGAAAEHIRSNSRWSGHAA